MSRKNAFGPIGRLEPPQLARDTFLLSKISEMVYSPISGSEMYWSRNSRSDCTGVTGCRGWRHSDCAPTL